ncbi:unnamed protein product, partial [Mycena citricolor]
LLPSPPFPFSFSHHGRSGQRVHHAVHPQPDSAVCLPGWAVMGHPRLLCVLCAVMRERVCAEMGAGVVTLEDEIRYIWSARMNFSKAMFLWVSRLSFFFFPSCSIDPRGAVQIRYYT